MKHIHIVYTTIIHAFLQKKSNKFMCTYWLTVHRANESSWQRIVEQMIIRHGNDDDGLFSSSDSISTGMVSDTKYTIGT